MEFTPPPSANFEGPADENSKKEAEGLESSIDEVAGGSMFSSSPFNWFGDLKNAVLGAGRKNPGKFDDLQLEAMSATKADYEAFQGLRAEFTRGVSQNFQVGHLLSMGDDKQGPSYQLITSYVTDSTLLTGRWYTNGLLLGRIKRQLLSGTSLGLMLRAGGERQGNFLQEASLDHSGEDYTAQLTYDGREEAFMCSFTQAISKPLSLGVQTVYHPEQKAFIYAGAARYETDKAILTAVAHSFGRLSATYTNKVSKSVLLSTELLVQPTQEGMDSTAVVGYEYRLRLNSVKAMLDSKGRLASLFEERYNEQTSFNLSGMIDYPNQKYSIGFGFALNL